MPAANVIELRQLLAEKFPGLRTKLEDSSAVTGSYWATGLPSIDGLLNGGLVKGALTEIIATGKTSGSASLLRALIYQAARENQIVTLVDGCDSCDVTPMEQEVLSRLLWVRCPSANDALKAADLLLRDTNLSLVLIDLAANSTAQLQKIAPTIWYRFQRLLEETRAVCVVFSPCPMVSAAQARITLHSSFGLAALERDSNELLNELKVTVSDAMQFRETARRRLAQ